MKNTLHKLLGTGYYFGKLRLGYSYNPHCNTERNQQSLYDTTKNTRTYRYSKKLIRNTI